MKKTLFILVFLGSSLFSVAQTDLYSKILHYLNVNYPKVSTAEKLIAVNIWSLDNPETREANKNFEKVYSVYEVAKLKGGSRGIIVISISKDNLSSTATIAMTRDGIKKLICVKAEDMQELPAGISNVVFDSKGSLVYKNLESGRITESIQQLITR